MPLPENDDNESVSREEAARRYGGGGAIIGFAILFLSWLVPQYVADKVAKCNTVAGDLYARTHAETGFGCTAANFVTDYAWAGYVIGAITLISGVVLFCGARDAEIREMFHME
jgi:hypothetical protein